MADIRIQNFIKQSRSLNIPDQKIAEDLISVGWDMKIVREAFDSNSKQKVLIRIQDLYKDYNPSKTLVVQAIQGIPRLEIMEGEFVAITGQSGSGKSTLLNLIGLIDDPTSGEIWFRDHNTKVMSESERARLRLQMISFIFQFFNLLDNYTALENIIFQCRLQGAGYYQAKTQALEILQFVNMSEKANLHPSQMSGGEQQRIAIGRALAKNSEVILADEPTAHLDTKNAENIMELLRDVNIRFGKTIILVTHEPDYAKFADRNIKMADGRIIGTSNQNRPPVDWVGLQPKGPRPRTV